MSLHISLPIALSIRLVLLHLIELLDSFENAYLEIASAKIQCFCGCT
jgi:hypothetical protein